MKVLYISPSTIPSRSANLIHVLFMCEALSKLGHDVNLFLHSENYSNYKCIEIMKKSHDIEENEININVFRSKYDRGKELGIALNAILHFIKDFSKNALPDFIISRNLYGAFLLGIVFRREVVYETHTPEKGLRKYIQDSLIASKKIKTVVISHSLKKIILENKSHLQKEVHVLHDAARAGRIRLTRNHRNQLRKELMDSISTDQIFESFIGYFGHLYSGRGIEIIQDLAKKNPKLAFMVYGGNDKEIEFFVNVNKQRNLFFMGHLNQSDVYERMTIMDVLLMPYQNNVSIGIEVVDTSKWMSPMKMFEYMSASVPIVSSNLKVLKEVLVNNENSILVDAENSTDWSNAINKILSSNELYKKLSENSYNDYINKYTWNIRVTRILELFSENKNL